MARLRIQKAGLASKGSMDHRPTAPTGRSLGTLSLGVTDLAGPPTKGNTVWGLSANVRSPSGASLSGITRAVAPGKTYVGSKPYACYWHTILCMVLFSVTSVIVSLTLFGGGGVAWC